MPTGSAGLKLVRWKALGIKPVGLNRPVELLRLSMGIVKKKASGVWNKRGKGVGDLWRSNS